MIAHDPVQHANNLARIEALRVKALPIFDQIANLPGVQRELDLARRLKQRRLVKVMVAVDATTGEVEVMQSSITSKKLSKAKD